MPSRQRYFDNNKHGIKIENSVFKALKEMYDDYRRVNRISTSYRMSQKKFLEKLIMYAKENWVEVRERLQQ